MPRDAECPLLILESVENDPNYLLEHSNMILRALFTVLCGGRSGQSEKLNHNASTSNYFVQRTGPRFAIYISH
jgi:hypothetical protein